MVAEERVRTQSGLRVATRVTRVTPKILSKPFFLLAALQHFSLLLLFQEISEKILR